MKLFDSLAHPTLTGNWLKMKECASFEQLNRSLDDNGFEGACAVAIDGIEGYGPEAFADACKPYPKLAPVAGYNPEKGGGHAADLGNLKDMGYTAVKIHPRFNHLDLDSQALAETFRAAERVDLPIIYCTYYHCAVQDMVVRDPLFALVRLLKAAPRAKVVLAHGGGVELLRYAELVRFNENLLLDLSLTICKYAGSSIDDDLRFVCSRLDERVCIGSDFPEYSHAFLRERAEVFCGGLSEIKQENIGFRNIMQFIGRA